VDLEHLKSLLDQVAEVGCLALAVVDLITKVLVSDFEEVENWEDLSVVGDKGLTNGVGAANKSLQDLEGD
jgi:hypothetical protein